MAAAADAVAKQYADMITMPVFGVVFDAYFDGGAGASQFAPLYEVIRTREEIEERSGNALEDPHFKVGEECEALFAHIEADGAYDLVDVYFEALCERLRTRLGVRVAAGSSEGELRYLLLDD